jgi:hypothetical protein
MIRALVADPQKALQKQHLLFCLLDIPAGCTTLTHVQPNSITRTHIQVPLV